ncbi:Uncharacterised protein [Klebsiella pneumoniae]|nr:Uncharacterised protein [Klebsiella pneumoniae]
MPLIVIQRENGVVAPLFAEMEHGIGRNRPDSVDPHLLGRFHRRDQIVSLFVTKQTIVGTMRVQGGHGNARIFDVQGGKFMVDLLNAGQHSRFVGIVTGCF